MTRQSNITNTSRTARAGAAIATIALAISACGSSDNADSPDATSSEPPATEPAVTEPTVTEPDPAEIEAAAVTTGEVSGTCAYQVVEQSGLGAELNQKCFFDDASDTALPDDFENSIFNYLEVAGAPDPAGGAEILAGGGDQGFVVAGTMEGGTAQLVAVRPGANDFEGSTAHVFAVSPPSRDGGFTMEWFVGDDPPFDAAVDGQRAIIEFECVLGSDTESCIYSGADARFVPEPDERVLLTIETEELTDPVDGATVFTSGAADGSVRAGLDDDDGLRRFTGIRNGTGELEGSLIEEAGWGRRVGDSFTGTIQVSVIDV